MPTSAKPSMKKKNLEDQKSRLIRELQLIQCSLGAKIEK